MAEETKKQNIDLMIVKEPATDPKGKEIKDKDGNLSYKREDYQGLLELLSLYDTRKRGSFMKEGRIYLALKDKISKNWVDNAEKVSLTLDEASFLKAYLSELNVNEGKEVRLPEYVMRTLFGVLDALA